MKEDELYSLNERLRAEAVDLQSLGLNEYGWARPRIQEVFAALLASETAVIGGDVYYEYDGRLESAYANWHCEPETGEQRRNFVQRSIRLATDYLTRVDDPIGKRAVFVPVIGEVL